MHALRRITTFMAICLVLVAGSAPRSAKGSSFPGISVGVRPRPAYTGKSFTILVKNVAAYSKWKLQMVGPPTRRRSPTVKLGVYGAAADGQITVWHAKLGMKGAHFNGSNHEVWIVDAEPAYPVGNEPGPYDHTFRMYKGCGCHKHGH